ncbi:MAG: type II secretion system F family protein [Planctomycetes bacterium]|jgi:type IV pilus assembly protein PilC|nr:type II secretion system F family protein [Planctomycetota bacterium]
MTTTMYNPPAEASPSAAVYAPRPKKVKQDDVIFITTQLAVMIDTGVPLTEALDSIADQTDHTGVKAMISDISNQVKAGVEFSAALEAYPKAFGKLFVALMKASEASGTMGEMLIRGSDYMQQERETRKRVLGAMIYPVCMLSFCMLVVVALLIFVLPRFEKIYAGKDAILPAPTRFLLGLSNSLVTYWPLILGVLAVVIGGGVYYFRTSGGRLIADKLRLTLPLFGGMYRKASLARSLRTMATMVSTGVSMLDGLLITAQSSGNLLYEKLWLDLCDSVKEGSSLSDELAKCDLVPRTITQMISAGERTGRLGDVMVRIAVFCEDDLKVAVKTITTMIEPVMIIVMGLLVGGIAMALLLPVFSVSKIMAK